MSSKSKIRGTVGGRSLWLRAACFTGSSKGSDSLRERKWKHQDLLRKLGSIQIAERNPNKEKRRIRVLEMAGKRWATPLPGSMSQLRGVPFAALEDVLLQIAEVIVAREIANPTPKDEDWTTQNLHSMGLVRMM